jgi:hypothetical protein
MLEPIVAYWKARLAYSEAIPDDVRITIGLAVLAALLGIAAVWWLWWRLPKREAARLWLDDPKARADVEDNFRKTVGQAFGGVVVLLGAGVALFGAWVAYLQLSQQQRAAHDLLISNQVAKGFEQLGSEKVVVKLGGIYALEGVMNNSDQYYRPVLEALAAFVREDTKASATPAPGPPTQGPPPTEIQAALTVIGRRSAGQGVVDLTKANIAGANLNNANLAGADLTGTDLTHANLLRANLAGADLEGADLEGANLEGVFAIYAEFAGANLARANLAGAALVRSHGLSQSQLDGACGSPAALARG